MGETSVPAWVVEKYGEAGVNLVVQGPGESRANPLVQYSEVELGRADEPSSGRDWIGPVYPSGDYVPLVCTPTSPSTAQFMVNNSGTILREFFFWGQNVEDDGAPDYLSITRDVAGG